MVQTEEVLNAMDTCEPYTAGEVAEKVETTRRTAARRLRELAESGDVRRKKHSERRVTWWVEE